MLGKRSDQRGLWEADRLYLDYVGKDTFYGLLASLRGQLFSDDDCTVDNTQWAMQNPAREWYCAFRIQRGGRSYG